MWLAPRPFLNSSQRSNRLPMWEPERTSPKHITAAFSVRGRCREVIRVSVVQLVKL
jgi:hypothetical protein